VPALLLGRHIILPFLVGKLTYIDKFALCAEQLRARRFLRQCQVPQLVLLLLPFCMRAREVGEVQVERRQQCITGALCDL